MNHLQVINSLTYIYDSQSGCRLTWICDEYGTNLLTLLTTINHLQVMNPLTYIYDSQSGCSLTSKSHTHSTSRLTSINPSQVTSSVTYICHSQVGCSSTSICNLHSTYSLTSIHHWQSSPMGRGKEFTALLICVSSKTHIKDILMSFSLLLVYWGASNIRLCSHVHLQRNTSKIYWSLSHKALSNEMQGIYGGVHMCIFKNTHQRCTDVFLTTSCLLGGQKIYRSAHMCISKTHIQHVLMSSSVLPKACLIRGKECTVLLICVFLMSTTPHHVPRQPSANVASARPLFLWVCI